MPCHAMPCHACSVVCVQILFESFNVRRISMQYSPLLALYGTGRTTGTIVDVGAGVTQVVPVYDGHEITAAAKWQASKRGRAL